MHSLVIIVLLLWSGVSYANPLRIDGDRFVDQEGRQVLLRGVNISGASKVPPFQVIDAAKDLAPLRGWGFNSLRLLFNWEAFEPDRDRYDFAYLHYYLNIIRWAAFYDLYVIVDVHQDAYSRFTANGCGEGFPKWTLPRDLVAAEPKNDESCKTWFISAVTDREMHKAWTEFYRNTGGVRDKYLAMIRRLSRALSAEPNVIGIDLLNEPWGEEETELHALYEDASKVVRREMPEAILFLSPVALTSLGLKVSTLPAISASNIVHAAHYYDPGLLSNSWTEEALDEAALVWKKILAEWSAPLFLGEFGAGPSLPKAAEYVNNIYDRLDQELYSGALWVYSPTWTPETKDGWNHEDLSITDEQGKLRGVYQPRPFVEKTPGRLLGMKWDRKGLRLNFRYESKIHGFFDLLIPNNLKWTGLAFGSTAHRCREFGRNRLRCEAGAERLATTVDVTAYFKIRTSLD